MMQKHNRIYIWRALAVTLFTTGVAAFIFLNSMQNGVKSSQLSSGFAKLLQDFFNLFGMELPLKTITFWIRKAAHVTEYAALGICFCFCYHAWRLRMRQFWPLVLLSGLFCAVVDEFIQSMIPGRSSEVRDILIDFSGVIVGLILALFLLKLVRLLLRRFAHKNSLVS